MSGNLTLLHMSKPTGTPFCLLLGVGATQTKSSVIGSGVWVRIVILPQYEKRKHPIPHSYKK